MTIKREDLAAAAALGLLHYRQIDPLLVFLLQRDVLARRAAMAAEAAPCRGGLNAWLFYLAALLAVVTAILFAVLLITRGVQSSGMHALFFPALLYAGGALSLVSWFKRRGYCARIRVFAAVMLASIPLALLALQQVAG